MRGAGVKSPAWQERFILPLVVPDPSSVAAHKSASPTNASPTAARSQAGYTPVLVVSLWHYQGGEGGDGYGGHDRGGETTLVGQSCFPLLPFVLFGGHMADLWVPVRSAPTTNNSDDNSSSNNNNNNEGPSPATIGWDDLNQCLHLEGTPIADAARRSVVSSKVGEVRLVVQFMASLGGVGAGAAAHGGPQLSPRLSPALPAPQSFEAAGAGQSRTQGGSPRASSAITLNADGLPQQIPTAESRVEVIRAQGLPRRRACGSATWWWRV